MQRHFNTGLIPGVFKWKIRTKQFYLNQHWTSC